MKHPNFMCLGSPKCGTTTLYDILKQHDDVYLTTFKEPHFFDIKTNYDKGYKWYINEYYKGAKDHKIVGEFTPSYLVMANVPERISQDIGTDIKFIVILRNPVDRAYSQYLHSQRDLLEDLSFEESLEVENMRLEKYVKNEDDVSYVRHSYIKGGLYYELLQNFFKVFDKSQFKVIIFEDEFMNNRSKLVADILSFLGLKEKEMKINIKSNQAAVTRYPLIKRILKKDSKIRKVMKVLIHSKELRSKLSYFLQKISNKKADKTDLSLDVRKRVMNKYFENDIMQLEKLIDRDLSIWYKK